MLASLSNMQLPRFFPGFDYSKDYVTAVTGNDYVEVEHRTRSRDDIYNFEEHNLLSYNQPRLTQASHSSFKNYLYHPLLTNRERLVILGAQQSWADQVIYERVLALIAELLIRERENSSITLSDILHGMARCIRIQGVAEGSATVIRANAINEWVQSAYRVHRKRTTVVDLVKNIATFEYENN